MSTVLGSRASQKRATQSLCAHHVADEHVRGCQQFAEIVQDPLGLDLGKSSSVPASSTRWKARR